MSDDTSFSQVNRQDAVPDKSPEYDPESPGAISNGTIFAYNLDDKKTPGGLKVRFKVRVATGPEAARWDARQAEAIKELLQWASQRRRPRPR